MSQLILGLLPILMTENERIVKSLMHLINNKILPGGESDKDIRIGPLEINDFSICFWVEIHIANGRAKRSLYVKIPKADLYKKQKREILPLSDEDIKLAEDEYNSLVYLSRCWCNDNIGVRFVKPLGFMKEYNAIITERFYAKHFFKMFKRSNLKNIFNKRNDATHHIMSRLGTALSIFHQTTIKECEFNVGGVLQKIQNICLQLKSFGIDQKFMYRIVSTLERSNKLEITTHYTNTLKGFDVRQVFIDKDGAIFLLDPGKMKTDYKEMDLARFIVTCRILYWGSMLFFLRVAPNISYEESFIKSYYGHNNKRLKRVLGLLIIKELLKHWRMAHIALGLKQWPLLIKKILKKTYIDPFYKWQITNELVKLES